MEHSNGAFSKRERKHVPHAQIEKRRREKMNHCLDQLRMLVPECKGQDNLQKLDILEMTVNYIKTHLNTSTQTQNRDTSSNATMNSQELVDPIHNLKLEFIYKFPMEKKKLVSASVSSDQLQYQQQTPMAISNMLQTSLPELMHRD